MTEEEKKAINIINGLGINMYDGKSQIISGTVTKEISTAIYTILNLIEKQEKELKKLKKQAEMTAKAHIELTENLDATIEKQEKVIDEMAKEIVNLNFRLNLVGKSVNEEFENIEMTEKYFFRKVENDE